MLFTSHVRTLGPINQSLLRRMAPEHVVKVDFATVHGIAARLLREAGLEARHQQEIADTCFWRAWAKVGRSSALAELGVESRYWKDEIATVIKGRGLARFEDYADLARVGRSTPLHAGYRRAVWDLYERYEELGLEKDVLDRDDVLLLVRDLIRAKADLGDTRYDAVIVDEVQDLTCAGLQVLHAFVGDKPDGLMIVGDGQQSIYPGGFTLTEAGVSVVGRSTVLQRNYRNREAILQYALAVVANDDFDDLDSDPQRGQREVHAERPGGIIVQVTV